MSTIRRLSSRPIAVEMDEPDKDEVDDRTTTSENTTDSNSSEKQQSGNWISKTPPRLREPLLEPLGQQ